MLPFPFLFLSSLPTSPLMYAKTCQTNQTYPRKGHGYQHTKGTEKFNAKLLAKAEIIVGSANKLWGMSSVSLLS